MTSKKRQTRPSRKAPPRVWLYLASRSPRRRAIVREMGLPFSCVESTYQEKHLAGKCPAEIVAVHALEKARAAVIKKRVKGDYLELVLGSDTLVARGNKAIGKPRSYAGAVRELEQLAKGVHSVFTAITLLNVGDGTELTAVEETRVYLKKWPKTKLETYVREINALDKAGGYGIQCSPCIVARCEGPKSNVVGLPKRLLRSMISSMKKRAALNAPQ